MQKEMLENLSELCLRDETLLTPAERLFLDSTMNQLKNNRQVAEMATNVVSAIAATIAKRATRTLEQTLEKKLTEQGWQTSYGIRAQQQPAPPSPPPMAPRPPSPTPGPGRAPSSIHLQSPSTDPKTGAPRPPSPTPGPAPTPGGISPLEASAGTVAVAERSELLPAQCVVLDEFLAPSELEALMRFARLHEPQYRVSEVISPGVQASAVDFEYRRSMVLFDIGEPGEALVQRARAYLPRVLEKLGHQPFRVSRTEAQITASNDGDFFRWHCDDGDNEIATREMTFVYFLHREPKPFQGGELRIYDSHRENGTYVPGADYRVVVPRQNQIVFFPDRKSVV